MGVGDATNVEGNSIERNIILTNILYKTTFEVDTIMKLLCCLGHCTMSCNSRTISVKDFYP